MREGKKERERESGMKKTHRDTERGRLNNREWLASHNGTISGTGDEHRGASGLSQGSHLRVSTRVPWLQRDDRRCFAHFAGMSRAKLKFLLQKPQIYLSPDSIHGPLGYEPNTLTAAPLRSCLVRFRENQKKSVKNKETMRRDGSLAGPESLGGNHWPLGAN